MGEEIINASPNKLFNKQNIACRISDETAELINEHFEYITGDIKTVSDRTIVKRLLDLALSKGAINLDAKKQIDALNDKFSTLTSENDRLNNQIAELNTIHAQEIAELQNRLSNSGDLSTEIQRLNNVILTQKTTISELQQQLQSSGASDDEITLTFTPNEKKVFDMILQAETKITKNIITPAGLLKSLFFYILFHGPYDMFHSNIPSLGTIKKMLSEQNQQELPPPEPPLT